MNTGDYALIISIVVFIWFLVFRSWVIDELNRLWRKNENN